MPSAKTIRQFLGGGGNFPNIDSARRPFLFGKYGWDIFFWCGFRNFQVPNFDPKNGSPLVLNGVEFGPSFGGFFQPQKTRGHSQLPGMNPRRIGDRILRNQ